MPDVIPPIMPDRSRLAGQIAAMLSVDPAADELEFEGRWSSWGTLAAQAATLGALLDGEGHGAGRRIGVLLRNRGEMVPVLLCLLGSDRCVASINASAPDDKLADDIRAAATPVIVASAADWARPGVLAAAQAVGALGILLAHDLLPGDAEPRIVTAADPALWTRPDAPGISIEMLSSGTTGTPKRIPLPTRHLERALSGAASYEKGRGADDAPRLRGGVQLVTAPLAHIAGITGVMNNILAGRKICLLERFTVEGFRDAVVRHRPKVAGAPPAALRMLLDADLPQADLASLVAYRTGTAPLDPELADAFYRKYGIPVLQNYGATEFAGGVAGWTLDDFNAHWTAKRGSVGRINRGTEARIVDPDSGAVLPTGEPGLLELKGGNVGNGRDWLRTTDLARLDEDRFLWITGRADGAIIRGGFKILPDDVVKALEAHPAIREAAVTGLPDRRLGEVPVAAYLLKRDAVAPTDEELRAFLKQALMPYQVPVQLRRLDEMPRTPSMKVSQPALRALFTPAA